MIHFIRGRLVAIAMISIALFASCSEQPSAITETTHYPRLYTLPSTWQTFDVGKIHNAEILYILGHYDTVKYASCPNKFSETAIDSLAALFITDSIQTSMGPLSSGEIAQAEAVFDSSFHASLTALPTHSDLVTSIDTAIAHGILATDEASFIINADSQIRQCNSFAEINDTISSLMAQYNLIPWMVSTSHGIEAYEYLNVGNASCHLWGGPSGNGGSGNPILVAKDPIATDQAAYDNSLNFWKSEQAVRGLTDDEVVLYASQASTAASTAAGTGNGGGGGGGNPTEFIGAIVFLVLCFLL